MTPLQLALTSNKNFIEYLEATRTENIIKDIKAYSNADRTVIATAVLQGMLASGCYMGDNSQYLSDIKNEAIPRCKDAVAWTDALITELNK